jgi:putative phage-type endonuclease
MPIITRDEMRSTHGIGASEVAAICHLDPWRTAYELWLDKTHRRPKEPQTEAMLFGIDMEPRAVAYWLQGASWPEKGIQVPAVHPTLPFLRAIADMWEDPIGCQIKCPSGDTTMDSMKRGVVPRHYLLQCAAEMSIFEAKSWEIFVYDAKDPENSEGAIIFWDDWWTPEISLKQFWERTAIPLITEFWRRIRMDEWPEHDPAWPRPSAEQWLAAWEKAKYAKELKSQADDMKEEADSEFKQMMGFEEGMIIAGIEARWSKRKGSVGIQVTCEDNETTDRVLSILAPLENAEGVESVEKKVRGEGKAFGVKALSAKQLSKMNAGVSDKA